MKAADITVGADYEAQVYGDLVRVRVLGVERRDRHVYSSARWDVGGHPTGPKPVVRVQRVLADDTLAREQVLTPQAVKRPWEDAAPDHAAKDAAHKRVLAAIDALKGLGVPAQSSYGGRGVTIYLGVLEAEALAARLGGGS